MNRICPRCKSKNIIPDKEQGASLVYSLTPEFICTRCKWRGMFFPVK